MLGLSQSKKRTPSPTGLSVGDLLARGWWALAAALILIVGLTLYGGRLDSRPVVDDTAVFAENAAVRNASADWLTASFYADTFRPIWRPVSTLSLRWNWQAAPGHRIPVVRTNLILMMAAGFLLAWLLRRLRLAPTLAIAGGLLFVVHAGLTDSVLRVAGRSELLAAVFSFSALIAFTFLAAGDRGWTGVKELRGPLWVLLGILLLLALLSHEIALLLPVWLLGLAFFYKPRSYVQGSAAQGSSAQGSAGQGSATQGSAAQGSATQGSAEQVAAAKRLRARAAAGQNRSGHAPSFRGMQWIALLMIVLAVGLSWYGFRTGVVRGWPHEMKMEPAPDYVAALEDDERTELALALPLYYAEMLFGQHVLPNHAHLIARPEGAPPIQIGNPRTFGVGRQSIARVAGGIAIMGVLLAGVLVFARRAPRAALGCFWTFTALAAALPLLSSNGHVASTRQVVWLLPGVLILLLAGAQHWMTRMRSRDMESSPPKTNAPGVMGPRAWANDVSPARRWVVMAVLVLLMGASYARARAVNAHWRSQNDLMSHLERIAPRSPEVPLYEGLMALQRRDVERGAALMELSVDRFPRNPRALLNLALLRLQLGDTGMGGRILSDAAVVTDQIMPNSAVACRVYLSMGSFLIEQDLRDEATEAYRKAVRADSLNAQAHARLGFMETNHIPTIESGLEHIDRALELDPTGRTLGDLTGQIIDLKQRAIDYLREEGLHPQSAGDSTLLKESYETPE